MCPGYVVDIPLVQNQLEDVAKKGNNISKNQVFEEVFNPHIPQHRLLQVEDINDYAVFLPSDKAKGVTGRAVVLDGGYVAQ